MRLTCLPSFWQNPHAAFGLSDTLLPDASWLSFDWLTFSVCERPADEAFSASFLPIGSGGGSPLYSHWSLHKRLLNPCRYRPNFPSTPALFAYRHAHWIARGSHLRDARYVHA